MAWWLLAPTAPVRVLVPGGGGDPVVVAPGVPELDAAQDGVLLLLVLAAGLVTGVAVALRPGRSPVAATLAAALGALVGSGLAVAVGQVLGPASLADQGASAVQDGSDGSLVSPLVLHAPGVLAAWPALALAVAALGHVVALRAGGRSRSRDEGLRS